MENLERKTKVFIRVQSFPRNKRCENQIYERTEILVLSHISFPGIDLHCVVFCCFSSFFFFFKICKMSISGTSGNPEVQEEIDLILQEEAINSCEGFRREATRIHVSEPLISYPQENSNVFQPQSGPPDPHTGSSPTGLKYSEPELEQIRDLFPWTLNIPGNLIQTASLQELSSLRPSLAGKG